MSADTGTIIATIPKSKIEEIRVQLTRYMDLDLLDLRIFTDVGADDGKRLPTKKGISIRVARLPDIIAALQLAEAEAIKRGLLGREQAEVAS